MKLVHDFCNDMDLLQVYCATQGGQNNYDINKYMGVPSYGEKSHLIMRQTSYEFTNNGNSFAYNQFNCEHNLLRCNDAS